MPDQLIDGKSLAAKVREEVAAEVEELGHVGLATVLVGDDPASHVYINLKQRHAGGVGIRARDIKLPAETTQEELLATIDELNNDDSIDGLLVQLPLPDHLDEARVIEAIDPRKDIDGIHPYNAGCLYLGRPTLVPGTPLGIMRMLAEYDIPLSGARAVVLGRSAIVGKPVSALLLRADCTVTMAHSKTPDLAAICREADIVVAAVGRAGMVRADWVKPGAIVIDVGINRVAGENGAARLVGDVDTEAAMKVAGAVTPVPGGVGPMTIACLLCNAVIAAHRRRGLPDPAV